MDELLITTKQCLSIVSTSTIKDEEIRQGRNATRTKGDAQKINNMIVRQEDYEKLKSDKNIQKE